MSLIRCVFLPSVVGVLAALLCGCAGAKVSGPGGAPVPITVVRFDNVRPGGGLGQQNIREFTDALTSSLVRFGYQPTFVDAKNQIPPSGLALSGGVTELPSDAVPRGTVLFYCTIYKDGREVKQGLYSQAVYPEDGSGGYLDPQNRAIKLALMNLMYDIEDVLKGPAGAEKSGGER